MKSSQQRYITDFTGNESALAELLLVGVVCTRAVFYWMVLCVPGGIRQGLGDCNWQNRSLQSH